MKRALNIILSIGNTFLLSFIAYKVYGWFSPHVGFKLPELSYLNVFAFVTIFSMLHISNFLTLFLELKDNLEDESKDIQNNLLRALLYLISLGINYLLYIILF